MKAYMRFKPTVQERRAMDDEINRVIAESMKKLESDIDACVLWSLREKYGFGKTRLLEFQKTFRVLLRDMIKYYELNKTDTPWLCKEKLLAIGIDVDQYAPETADCKLIEYETR